MKTKWLMILAMLTVAFSMMAQKDPNAQKPEEKKETTTLPPTPVAVEGEVYTVSLPAKNGMDELSFDMILVKSGRFLMGATPEQPMADDDEKPAHIVLISKDYYIGETEVTQEVWEYVMGGNPSVIKGPKYPAESMSWEEAGRFCERLSALTGQTFRLPTEAEWEYAARGGHKYVKPEIYAGGFDPNSVGWNLNNSRANLNEVKGKAPNELGIYDMSGNVFEYCQDTKDKYPDKQVTDPLVIKDPTQNKVRRGGSCKNPPDQTRVSFRRRVGYDKKSGTHPGSDDTGLRVVMEKPAN